MQAIHLVLTTARGDELGRLVLPDIAVAAAGEARGSNLTKPATGVAELQTRIHRALAAEGIEVTLDALDLQIQISRGLLRGGNEDHILLSLPVRALQNGDSKPAQDRSLSSGGHPAVNDPSLLDGLFDLPEGDGLADFDGDGNGGPL